MDKKIKYRGSKQLSQALDFVNKPVFDKRGFTQMRIITDWEKIVGEFIASSSVPRKLVFQRDKTSDATLHVEVANSSIATEMAYMELLIIEKIATYFGYKAVSRLKILQNLKVQIPQKIQKVRSVRSVGLPENVKNIMAEIEDDDLKTALSNLWGNM